MVKHANNWSNTISAALSRIDPKGTYVPLTVEINWVKGSLTSWIVGVDSDEVMRMPEPARRTLRQKAIETTGPSRRSAPEASHTTSNLDLSLAAT